MSNQRYTPEFKDEAVRQVVDRGYRVAEVAEGLGVSTNSLHKWVKSIKPSKADEQTAELVEYPDNLFFFKSLAFNWFLRGGETPIQHMDQ